MSSVTTLFRFLTTSAAVAAVSLVVAPVGGQDETCVRLLERAAARAASDRIDAPDRFEVLSVRAGTVTSPRGDACRVEVAGVEGPTASGVVAVTARVISRGVPREQKRVLVRGKVYGPALVATRTLGRGKVIDPGDLTMAVVDLTRLREPPLRSLEAAQGLVPIRTLGMDRVLTRALLVPAPVVRRGDTVDLTVERERVIVRVVGRARRDGAPGEVVPVENTVTGTVVLGRVLRDGSLVVIGRPAGRTTVAGAYGGFIR